MTLTVIAVVATIVNIASVLVNLLVYKRNRSLGYDPKKHTLPLLVGEGVVLLNKDKKPVVRHKKPLEK